MENYEDIIMTEEKRKDQRDDLDTICTVNVYSQ